MKRWILLGWLCVAYMSGLCFLGPLSSAVRLEGNERVLVAPRGRGDGVVVRQLTFGLSSVHVIDADLRTPGVRVDVQARNPSRTNWGWSVADALTVPDWCRVTGAVAGINGGFFGEEKSPGRKEVIGLLRTGGRTYARAPLYRTRGGPRTTYAHSAFGVQDGRQPLVGWVVSDRRSPKRLLAYPQPENLRGGRPWRADAGLSGGPRLIHRGRPFVAAKSERLASAGALPRTFLGYSRSAGGNRLVLCTAAAMTYSEAAQFLDEYFRERHGVPCDEGMCLDGGPSSQLAYRAGGELAIAQGGAITVPTAILIHDEQRRIARRAPAP